MTTIRRARDEDLPQIASIRMASAEAAQWDAGSDCDYRILVAEIDGSLAGFLAGRTIAPDEHEILNLAVHPDFRRRGAARSLVADWLRSSPGAVYLEVRESNAAARSLYKSMGFQEVGTRAGYYISPPEPAIVLKFHSC